MVVCACPRHLRPGTGPESQTRMALGALATLSGYKDSPMTHRMSEDCLQLNLIRPAGTRATDRQPVLVWIHGGGWQEGSANDGRCNRSFIAQRSKEMGMPIMFVSFNYRLGVFGMMAGSAIRWANVTNLGLYDQRQALAWIPEKIGAFGDDPSRVTVMGESAGALSIGCHLLAYKGRDDGLFSAAITQSGGPFSADPVGRNYTEQEADFELVLNTTGCADSKTPLDCLRGVPAEVLNQASALLPPYFVVDGQLLPNSSMDSSQDRPFVRVPLLTGTTRNEGTFFTQQSP
ncbi:Carboxylic ester hydrolase [Fusarium falciforme]|uniref:Carboxylic ester hydrolase n=1 Tax=Fusarium falciforme TaxID=195108 RepID=UPI002300DDAE|nr:Carboxylic ester hydrolase [Fusarium falciforme]WAO87064.1 Carboxylic ester hydrolase [Fusarium falciforme]